MAAIARARGVFFFLSFFFSYFAFVGHPYLKDLRHLFLLAFAVQRKDKGEDERRFIFMSISILHGSALGTLFLASS